MFSAVTDLFSQQVSHIINITIGAIMLIPATIITISAMRFIGGFSFSLPSVINESGSVESWSFLTPAAYMIIIIGIILLISGLVMIHEELKSIKPSSVPPQRTISPRPPHHGGDY